MSAAEGPVAASPDPATLRAGATLVATTVYSQDDDAELIAMFEGLRVSDVSDGMDAAGLADVGLVDPAIHPLWRDTKDFGHRIVGVAVTARYIPTQQAAVGERPVNEFNHWMSTWYQTRSSEAFHTVLRPGSVLVIQDAPGQDVGTIGSNNILAWRRAGCVGVVTDGGARDTDEIIAERTPVYLRQVGRGIRPGRTDLESVNRPVVIGGVMVNPGDIIVADGDGVIVVPRARAREVAGYAQYTVNWDKNSRQQQREKAGEN